MINGFYKWKGSILMKSKVINFIARPIVKLFYNENNNYGIYKIKLTDEEYMHIENIAEKEAIEALEEDFNNDCYYAIICGSMQSQNRKIF